MIVVLFLNIQTHHEIPFLEICVKVSGLLSNLKYIYEVQIKADRIHCDVIVTIYQSTNQLFMLLSIEK